ncbi:hypothetical protein VTK26DRAFT_7281 [Humicola hyalothermophila]
MRKYASVVAALSASFGLVDAAPCSGSAPLLFVAAYEGQVTTLQLGESTLQTLSTSDGCGPYPSWLTQAGDILYCINEAWPDPTGSLSSLKIGNSGALTQLNSIPTLPGPVSIAVYGNNSRGVAVANYGGEGINTYDVSDPTAIVALQSDTFPKPDESSPYEQQTQSRPHQAVLDPTGDFLLFPDLGSDLLRVFKVDQETLSYTELNAHQLERGTGPRHATFFVAESKTFLYVVTELANTIIGFEVTYSDDGLSLSEVYSSNTHGGTDPLPEEAKAAEITVSPDNKFLTVSSRLESSQEFTLANGTTVPSDPLITFSIDAETGKLTHVQTAPAGGINPRHFSFNKDGTRVASALQDDSRVVVFERDVATGEIGKALAETSITGLPNFVMFKQ